MNTNTLMLAAAEICKQKKETVMAIQFEDGSGHNFNYQLFGSTDWHFINLGAKWHTDVICENEDVKIAIKEQNTHKFEIAVVRIMNRYNDLNGLHLKMLLRLVRINGKDLLLNELFDGDSSETE